MANKRAYYYSIDEQTFTSLQAGVPITVPISAPLDFVATAAIYSCDVAAVMAGTDVAHGGYLIDSMGDGSDQNSLLKKSTPISHVFGRAGISDGERRLPFVLRIANNGSIEMRISSLVAATSKLRLTFVGFQWPVGEPLPD